MATMTAVRSRGAGALNVLALALGACVGIAANLFYTGMPLSLTAAAKLSAYQPDHGLVAVGTRAWSLFVGRSFMMPEGKHLDVLAPLAPVLLIAAAHRCWLGVRDDVQALCVFRFVLAHIVLVPLAFAYGGVIFSWYLWPSAWLAHAVFALAAASFAETLRPRRLLITAGVLAAMLIGVAYQFVLSLNWGAQEHRYRASVGRDIAKIATHTDTLFLEPAGYIPFYAGITTFDEIGLVSPRVLPYHALAYPERTVRFVEEQRPTFIVMRPGEALSLARRRVLDQDYDLLRHYEYEPTAWARNAVERLVLPLGSHSDYYLFRRSDTKTKASAASRNASRVPSE